MKTSRLLSLLSLFASFSAVAGPGSGPGGATLKDLNGIVAGFRCSGALVTLGRADAERAVVLAAGHCTAPSTMYPPGTAEGGTIIQPGEESISAYLPSTDPIALNNRPTETTNYPIYSVLYGTMTLADVSLYELGITIGEMKALGYRFYELADSLPKPGDKLTVTSGLWGQTQNCSVAEIFADNSDEKHVFGSDSAPYSFRNMILLANNCTAQPGWSGSPLFNPETGLIYGVLSRLQSRVAPSSLAPLTLGSTFMRSTFMNTPTAPGAEIVASNVLDLKDCLTNDGKVATSQVGCMLPHPKAKSAPLPPAPKPTPQPRPSPKPPGKSPGSTWPR